MCDTVWPVAAVSGMGRDPFTTHAVCSLCRDPFAIHRQHMSRMLSGGFGYSPFLSITDGNMPGTRPASRRMQVSWKNVSKTQGKVAGWLATHDFFLALQAI